MKEETYGIIWGTASLVIGLVILFVVFSNAWDIAQNPSQKLNEWAPVEIKGPTALFNWWSNDTSVGFSDISVIGDSEINSWDWDFGDGSTSEEESPSHKYSDYEAYTVSLEVTDENGKIDSAQTRVTVNEESNEGQVPQGMSFDLGLGDMLTRMAISVLVIGIHAVLIMIGGRIILAGCRLLRPVPKNVRLKIKPSDMELEIPSQRKNEFNQDKSSQRKEKKSWFRKK